MKRILLLVLAPNLLLLGCQNKNGPTPDLTLKLVQKGNEQVLILQPENGQLTKSVVVQEIPTPAVLETTGQIAFDDKRVLTISSRVNGRIEDVAVSLWDPVQQGDPILKIYSPDFMTAEEEYLQSKKNLNLTGGVNEVSQMMWNAAKRKLLLLGMQESDIVSLSSPTMNFWMKAPLSGTILQNQSSIGSVVIPGQVLYQLANMDRVWITADIYEGDLSKIQVGEELEATTEAFPNEIFRGVLSRISPQIDPNAHTAQVKCEIENPKLKLKPQMLARVKIKTKGGSALLVPQKALVYDGDGSYAFVEVGPNQYIRRKVETISWNEEDTARVISGLKGGDRIAIESLKLNELWHQTRGESY